MVFGSIGGSFQVPRILTVFFLPLALNSGGINNRYIKSVLVFFCALYIYGVFSIIWTPNGEKWVKDLFYYPLHILYFLEICLFSRQSDKALSIIAKAWVCTVLLSSIIGVWEIITDNHLAISVQEGDDYWNDDGVLAIHRFASATFGNMNTYITYLSMSLPFVCYAIFQMHERLLRMIGIAALAVIVFIFSNNASRGGFLCISISIIVLLWSFLRNKSRGSHRWFFLLLITIVTVIALWGDVLFYGILIRTQQKAMFEDNARVDLIERGLKVFSNYYGMGAGMGGGETALHETDVNNKFWAYHNFFMEFMGSWGLWIVGLLMLVFKLFKKGLSLKERSRKIVFTVAVISLLPLSIIDSGYLESVHTWAFYASLFVFAYYEYIRPIRKVLL